MLQDGSLYLDTIIIGNKFCKYVKYAKWNNITNGIAKFYDTKCFLGPVAVMMMFHSAFLTVFISICLNHKRWLFLQEQEELRQAEEVGSPDVTLLCINMGLSLSVVHYVMSRSTCM